MRATEDVAQRWVHWNTLETPYYNRLKEPTLNLPFIFLEDCIFGLLYFHSPLQRVALLHGHLKHLIKRAADDEEFRFQYRLLTR